jgi:hypothetical protein
MRRRKKNKSKQDRFSLNVVLPKLPDNPDVSLSPHDSYTGLSGGLEHLKIETRLTDERHEREMGECVI